MWHVPALVCFGMLQEKLCSPRLNDLVEGALENLRYSLGQKVLMLNPEEGVAAGTSKHCISCFKDRSQSPVRGSVGDLVATRMICGTADRFRSFCKSTAFAQLCCVSLTVFLRKRRPSLPTSSQTCSYPRGRQP